MSLFNSIDLLFYRLFVLFGGTGFAAVCFKLVLAVLLSGIIGLERGAHRQNAGFRTYILVCVGSCVAMMTDMFIVEYISGTADPARLGAQVITGVGFLGAGTIVLAGRHVVGLTTAAGLWASACLGLAVGVGYFEVALIAGILIFLVLEFLPKLEERLYSESKYVTYHIELRDAAEYNNYREYVRDGRIIISRANVSKTPPLVAGGISFRMSLERPEDMSRDEIEEYLEDYNGVYIVEEL